MTYKFKSRATADLIMLDANGRKLLEIMGKSPEEPSGVVTVEQMPAAIAALEAAAAAELERSKSVTKDGAASDEGDVSAQQDPVGLGQRIVPLVDMLRRSAAAGKDVTW